jgi:serine protease Do
MPNKIKCFLFILIVQLAGCASATSTNYSNVFKQVNPAVVVIKTKQSYQLAGNNGPKSIDSGGLGSGIIISKDGLIMTAAHVVDLADEVIVELNDGQSLAAKVVSSSTLADVALIKLIEAPAQLPFIEPGNSDAVDIGDPVFVIGSPYGLEHTLTVGYLSGRRITSGEDAIMDLEFLQTDAAVNQGNSGGPLFTASGQLIGIVSHIATQSGGNEGLGFAASINMTKAILMEQSPPWFGAQMLPLKDKLADAFNIPYHEGLLVQRVAKGSIAEKLGLKAGMIPVSLSGNEILLGGDVIVEVGGDTVFVNRAGRDRIFNYLKSLKSGDDLTITVMRNGEKLTLSATKP